MLRSLASAGGSFGDNMVFGIGDTPPTVNDTELDFEIHRTPVDLVDYDDVNYRVIYRATVPDQRYFELHEIGLLTEDANIDTESPSQVISLFDESEQQWSGYDSIETVGVRSGTGAFRLNDGGTISSGQPIYNFASAASTDIFTLAYNLLSGSASIDMRLVVDVSNYRSMTIAPAAGFNVHKFLLSDFAETGTAPLDQITSVEFVVTGTSELLLEGLRIDNDSSESDVLLSRTLVVPAIRKIGVVELQVEYRVGVAF